MDGDVDGDGEITEAEAAQYLAAIGMTQVAWCAQDEATKTKLLEKAEWAPAPELSGAFQAGHIFEETSMGHRLLGDSCIDSAPRENPYTAADVITSLQAGVQVGGLAARGEVTGEVVKKIKFGTPVQSSLPRLDLVLTEACTAKLQRLPRAALERSYVIQEVLRAQISEQTCGRVDASGRIVGLGAADAELQRACSQASLEPVAVGYRTVPLVSLMALGAAAPSPSTPPPVTPPPVTPSTPSAASASERASSNLSAVTARTPSCSTRCSCAIAASVSCRAVSLRARI